MRARARARGDVQAVTLPAHLPQLSHSQASLLSRLRRASPQRVFGRDVWIAKALHVMGLIDLAPQLDGTALARVRP